MVAKKGKTTDMTDSAKVKSVKTIRIPRWTIKRGLTLFTVMNIVLVTAIAVNFKSNYPDIYKGVALATQSPSQLSDSITDAERSSDNLIAAKAYELQAMQSEGSDAASFYESAANLYKQVGDYNNAVRVLNESLKYYEGSSEQDVFRVTTEIELLNNVYLEDTDV